MPDLDRTAYLQMLIPLLREHEAFTDLTVEEIVQFADAAEFRFCEQGSLLIRQGEPGNDFYVVLEGQLRVLDMNYTPPHLLNYHDRGHIVGVRALLNNLPRAATVEAIIDTRVAIFDRSDWDWLIHRYPRIITYFQDLEREFEQRSTTEFPGRQWDEVVVMSTKRHILVLMAKLSFPLTLLIFPILLLIIFNVLGINIFADTPSNQILEVLAVFPFVILAIFLIIYHYIDWRNDDFILTTKRFIHIERKLLFGEQRDESPLTRIQDVWLAYPGFLDRFDYYHLRVKTAGAGDIRIKGITKAQQMKDQIFREKERAMERVQAANVAAVRQLLAKELDWQDTLEETILAIAEEEGGMTTRRQPHRLPNFIRYFWPRVQDIEPDGTTITWRKHYWVLLGAVGLPVLALWGSFYLLLAAGFGLFPFVQPSTSAFVWFLFIGITVASIFWYLWCYDGWRRDIYQVTQNRIIDVTSSPFGVSGEVRSEGNLDDIQNITYEIPNLLSAVLNMGSVVIETAGTMGTFTFRQVFKPSAVQQEIFNRMVRVQQREREERRDATTRDLLKVFAEYQYLLEKASERGIIRLGQQNKETG
ncbi:MAG: cyclic nucleotide-binding domain-containing protein [Anaerolineae bacterium]|nr:cyclic nucleotide-binding domain-containing protein [Anaerolineae bacterium]